MEVFQNASINHFFIPFNASTSSPTTTLPINITLHTIFSNINNTISPNDTLQTPPANYPLPSFGSSVHYAWLFVALLVLIVNIFVLYLFKTDSKLLRGVPGNHILLSLSVSDLLTGTVGLMQCIPFLEVHWFKTSTLLFNMWYVIFSDLLITFLSVTSVIHLCFVAGERYLAIFYALQFKGLVTTRRVRCALVAAWALAFCIGLVPLTWVWREADDDTSMQERSEIREINVYYSAVSSVMFCLLPLFVLTIAYTKMFVMCSKLIRQAPDNLLVQRRTLRKEVKILIMYFVMFLIFLLLCVPFFTIRLLHDVFYMANKGPMQIGEATSQAFMLMRFLTSAINPFIYTIYKQDFRRTVKKLCCYRRLRRMLTQASNSHEDGVITREIFASITTQTVLKRCVSPEQGIELESALMLSRQRHSEQIEPLAETQFSNGTANF